MILSHILVSVVTLSVYCLSTPTTPFNICSAMHNWIPLINFSFKVNTMFRFLSRGHWRNTAGGRCFLKLLRGVRGLWMWEQAVEPAQPRALNTTHLWFDSFVLGIMFPQPSQHGNKSYNCLWPEGSHREQPLDSASFWVACLGPGRWIHISCSLCQPLHSPCTLTASCSDRRSDSHCMALPPAANHLLSLHPGEWPIACLEMPDQLQPG